MVHLALALSLATFCLGVVAVTFGLFAWMRVRAVIFRRLALVFVAALALLAVPLLRSYGIATASELGTAENVVYGVLYAFGFGLFALMIPAIAFDVCSLRPSELRRAAHLAAGVIAAGLGAWHGILPGPVPDGLAYAALIAIQVYGVVILVPRLPGIADASLRTLLRRLCVIVGIGGVVSIAQYVLVDIVPLRADVRGIPVAQILYFVLNSAALLAYGLRSTAVRTVDGDPVVPESFVQRHGISPREKEIIELIASGHSNRMIAETLFISAMTVKNHIYHIYRKTGVENKIQLLNLLKAIK